MHSKIYILRFPLTEVQKPIVCNLCKSFDLTFNILNATIYPRREGKMVIEITGSMRDIKEGMSYLKSQGVEVIPAEQEVSRNICLPSHECPAARSIREGCPLEGNGAGFHHGAENADNKQ